MYFFPKEGRRTVAGTKTHIIESKNAKIQKRRRKKKRKKLKRMKRTRKQRRPKE